MLYMESIEERLRSNYSVHFLLPRFPNPCLRVPNCAQGLVINVKLVNGPVLKKGPTDIPADFPKNLSLPLYIAQPPLGVLPLLGDCA